LHQLSRTSADAARPQQVYHMIHCYYSLTSDDLGGHTELSTTICKYEIK